MSTKITLWKTFSEYIRRKDADDEGYNSCVTCGRTKQWKELDCGHYRPNTERSKTLGGNELWYDERNFGPQCISCNRFKGGMQADWSVRLVNQYGYKVLEELRDLRNTLRKWTQEELDELHQKYKDKLFSL